MGRPASDSLGQIQRRSVLDGLGVAAIAAYLAKGAKPVDAVRMAKEYVTGAIQHSFSLGAGHGPLHHMWAFSPGKPSS